MSHSQSDFDEFFQQRIEASNAFISGDFSALSKISVQNSPATLFTPNGTCINGAQQVNAVNAEGATHFKPGGTNAFEVLHTAAGDEFAYWVGIQRSTVPMEGSAQPVQFNLRITELYRRENGTWKLFHRHADPLKSGETG